jgi:hypothetical protein
VGDDLQTVQPLCGKYRADHFLEPARHNHDPVTPLLPRRGELGEAGAHAGSLDGLADDLVVVTADRLELAPDALVERDLAGQQRRLDLVVDLRRVPPDQPVEGVLLGDRAVEVDNDQPAVGTAQ